MKIRLQRYMADCGVASRRECEAMIEGGRVKVNDRLVRALPAFVDPVKDVVAVDDTILTPATAEGEAKVYLLLNKPKGILVTNYDPSQRKTVGELMDGVKERVYPVGRLDMDSRGALIMTNDGELANRLTHPRYGVEKTYIVEVEGRMGPEDVERVKKGAWLGPTGGPARAGTTRHIGERTERFHIKILGKERGRTILEARVAESKNREIRRVMARIGHPVRDLNRVAIAEKITIKNLAVGAYRKLTAEEVEWLFEASSMEHHEKGRAATQQWFEQKEMEKERKRLQTERVVQAKEAVRAKERKEKKAKRERPVKKGKKPFVPPSGRNIGKAIGGTKLGRKNFERARERAEAQEEFGVKDVVHPPTPKMEHPLGDRARNDD